MGLIVFGWAPQSSAQVPDYDATVTLQNTAYNPAATTLSKPGIVRWIHRDGETPHTVTLDHKDGQSDFDSHPNCSSGSVEDCWQQSDSNSDGVYIRFNSPGVYTYHCKIHPDVMKGSVTVQGTAATGATTTTKVGATTTTKATNTTVGTLTTTSTTAEETTTSSTSAAATTSSSIDFTTQTTIGGSAAGTTSDDDDKPSGVLEAVGVLLLAAVVAALIPAWRRLT